MTNNSNPSRQYRRARPTRRIVVFAGLVLAGTASLAACSSASTTKPAAPSAVPANGNTTQPGAGVTPASAASSGAQVLPVATNPIVNNSSIKALVIDGVMAENNVDAAGKTVDDHLEIALSNTGSTPLSGVEVFYTFTDPTTGTVESYYSKLPTDFSIPANGKRIAHFDNTGAVDHFPVSDFSLYKTSTNALDVTVTVSAKDSAVQKMTIKKDAGGAEVAGA